MHDAVRHEQPADAMTKLECHAARALVRANPMDEWLDHCRSGAARDVKARDTVTRATRARRASLSPADCGKPPHAHRAQPSPLLAGGKVDVGMRPAQRPVIVLAIEASGVHPVA